MSQRITLIQGHPDPAGGHFCHALADAYAAGAEAAGYEVRRLEVSALDFPLLRSQAAFEGGPLPADIALAQQAISWAGHLVMIYPLWLGSQPALLKAFMEQTFRPGFALEDRGPKKMPGKPLKGRSARIVVTMGMPAWLYRWYFGAHGLKNLKRSILGLAGLAPIRDTLIGSIETSSGDTRQRWLARLEQLGRKGC